MKIIFKSEKGNFNAIANYNNNSVIVLKDSIISSNKYNCKISEHIKNLRENKKLVKNFILQEDIEFSSLSSAAEFVSGYKANGLRVWKTIEGKK